MSFSALLSATHNPFSSRALYFQRLLDLCWTQLTIFITRHFLFPLTYRHIGSKCHVYSGMLDLPLQVSSLVSRSESILTLYGTWLFAVYLYQVFINVIQWPWFKILLTLLLSSLPTPYALRLYFRPDLIRLSDIGQRCFSPSPSFNDSTPDPHPFWLAISTINILSLLHWHSKFLLVYFHL